MCRKFESQILIPIILIFTHFNYLRDTNSNQELRQSEHQRERELSRMWKKKNLISKIGHHECMWFYFLKHQLKWPFIKGGDGGGLR